MVRFLSRMFRPKFKHLWKYKTRKMIYKTRKLSKAIMEKLEQL